MEKQKAIAGPAWDNSSEYKGVGSADMIADIERAQALVASLEDLNTQISLFVERAEAVSEDEGRRLVMLLQEAAAFYHDAYCLVGNVKTYLNCELSVNGKNAAAKSLLSKLDKLASGLEQANSASRVFLRLTTQELAEAYLHADHTAPERFQLQQSRKLKNQTLSLQEESLIIALAVDGRDAWGDLYTNLSSSITASVQLPGGARSMGLAQATSYLQDERDDVRHAAFRGINAAWEAHEESVAAGLNALGGWRHEIYRRRSIKEPVHFLDAPLHSGRVSRQTLEAMMNAVREARGLGQRVLKRQAKLLSKERLDPWDLFAPCPDIASSGDAEKSWIKPSFDEAIELIADSYSGINPEMGEFVHMMARNRWIEGTLGPNKRTGAYCTKFIKSRTPRVYMTYTGGMRELKTLAHELGHAFHNWVMRDMPLVETQYPMTLAETASIFGETVLNHAMLERAQSPADRLAFTWAEAREVESLLLNIPARFDFEKAFYERRQEATVTPDDLKQMMSDAWRDWYGDCLSEVDPMFWASKLHFSIPGLSFYNFPYTFGYLFALGVYAQKAKLKDEFYPSYVSLLRDTGRMTVEDVAMKHLGADLTQPAFWRESLKISEQAVKNFENSLA